jgi:hypothetical protein
VFERFTDRARRVLVLAQEESRLLRHDQIGTEHILGGLVYEGEGVAAQALTSLGVTLKDVREAVLSTVGEGTTEPSTASPPFTPRAKKLLERSLREALHLRHNHIGPEHLLLALVHEEACRGSDVLVALGVEPEKVRAVVQGLLGRSDPLLKIAAEDVTLTDTPLDPATLLTLDDVDAALREHPIVDRPKSGGRHVGGVHYQWCSFSARAAPTIWFAVAAAEVTVAALERAVGGPDDADWVAPVEGVGDRASFDRRTSTLTVLSGSTLFVITVAEARNESLELTSALARKVLRRLEAHG